MIPRPWWLNSQSVETAVGTLMGGRFKSVRPTAESHSPTRRWARLSLVEWFPGPRRVFASARRGPEMRERTGIMAAVSRWWIRAYEWGFHVPLLRVGRWSVAMVPQNLWIGARWEWVGPRRKRWYFCLIPTLCVVFREKPRCVSNGCDLDRGHRGECLPF